MSSRQRFVDFDLLEQATGHQLSSEMLAYEQALVGYVILCHSCNRRVVDFAPRKHASFRCPSCKRPVVLLAAREMRLEEKLFMRKYLASLESSQRKEPVNDPS